VAEQFDLLPKKNTISQVLVTVFDPKNLKDSARAAASLRQANINTEVYPDPDERLNKQLKYASKKGIPWVVVVGPEEAEQGKIALKNMPTSNQDTLTIEKAIEKIKT
jgi:histidyl-tRNA synthetase